jgi:putative DNA primase/helicase
VVRCRPAIEGQDGDRKTFKVARIIFHDYGLSEEEGRPILDEYNERCQPPWDEKALQHKIDIAIAYAGAKPKGWQRFAKPIEGEYHPPFGAFVLSPQRTKPSAEAFLREKYKVGKITILKFYQGEFYRWQGTCYQQVHKNIIRGEVLKWLTGTVMLKKEEPVAFPANSRTVNDVVDALKSICTLPDETMPGTWLVEDDDPPVLSPIFVRNCVYDWEKDEKYEHDPRWFNLSCLDARIRANVPPPERWLRFLDELWGDDCASKALLHEFMGLTLTMDTSFQKMLLLVGQIRAGKGTILRILTEIHRKENVATPSTTSLTESFGLQPLLGKPVAIVADARFSGKDIQVAIERLLNISGEDDVTVNRKFKDPMEFHHCPPAVNG